MLTSAKCTSSETHDVNKISVLFAALKQILIASNQWQNQSIAAYFKIDLFF